MGSIKSLHEPRTRLHPPYDTGKVKIGLAYFPVQQGPLSADMFRLQTALLGPRVSIRVTWFERVWHWLQRLVFLLSHGRQS